MGRTGEFREQRWSIGVLGAAVLLAGAISGPRIDAQSESAIRDRLIVTPAWVAQHLRDADLVLLHVGDTAGFVQTHIPGARLVTLQDVSAGMDGPMDMNGKLMLEMLPPDVLRARLERLGISTHSHVVVYGVSDRISPTTRIAYTLRYAGLGSSTSLMDGGLNAWTAEGHPVAHGAPEPVKSGTLAARAEPSLVVDAAWVQAHASHPGIALLDARQVGFYDGTQQDDGPRRGHIPGAKSLPFEDLYDAQGRLRSPAELTARFHQAGVTQGDTVVAYCHIGQRATAVLLAAETLGYPVRLYDGSFQEWGRRSDLPVEGGQ